MVKNRDAVISKIFNLGLKQLKEKDNGCATRRLSSSFKIPKQLPSVEDELKKLSAALEALETPGLDQAETQVTQHSFGDQYLLRNVRGLPQLL